MFIVLKIGIAMLAGLLIWKVGAMMLGGLARPIPEPPPPGRAPAGPAALPLLDLRHRGAHDRGKRRGPRAAPPLPRGHGPRRAHRVSAAGRPAMRQASAATSRIGGDSERSERSEPDATRLSTGCGEGWGESHRCNSAATVRLVVLGGGDDPGEDQTETAEQDPVARVPDDAGVVRAGSASVPIPRNANIRIGTQIGLTFTSRGIGGVYRPLGSCTAAGFGVRTRTARRRRPSTLDSTLRRLGHGRENYNASPAPQERVPARAGSTGTLVATHGPACARHRQLRLVHVQPRPVPRRARRRPAGPPPRRPHARPDHCALDPEGVAHLARARHAGRCRRCRWR